MNAWDKETCSVIHYFAKDCEYMNGTDVIINDFSYEYIMESQSKCGNDTLYIREEEMFMGGCGVKSYEMHMNVSCYVRDCDKNEYSFIGFDQLTFDAKYDIELGCIVLIVTAVPFVSFICWLSLCYKCGPK